MLRAPIRHRLSRPLSLLGRRSPTALLCALYSAAAEALASFSLPSSSLQLFSLRPTRRRIAQVGLRRCSADASKREESIRPTKPTPLRPPAHAPKRHLRPGDWSQRNRPFLRLKPVLVPAALVFARPHHPLPEFVPSSAVRHFRTSRLSAPLAAPPAAAAVTEPENLREGFTTTRILKHPLCNPDRRLGSTILSPSHLFLRSALLPDRSNLLLGRDLLFCLGTALDAVDVSSSSLLDRRFTRTRILGSVHLMVISHRRRDFA